MNSSLANLRDRHWSTPRPPNCIISLDIGGTHLRIGAVDTTGRLRHFQKGAIDVLGTGRNPLDRLAEFIARYIHDHVPGKPVALALAFPCLVDPTRKIVYAGPNLRQFDRINVVDPLAAWFGIPVFLDKDANRLLYWDILENQIPHHEIVLGFYVGTGLGNAIYLHDEFLSGKHGVAGELGHIPFPNATRRCGCGNTGCAELYAAGQALRRIADESFPGTNITDIFVHHHNARPIQRYLQTLALPLTAEINVFDPHHIILGGGVIGMKGFPRGDLERYLRRHLRKPFPAADLHIHYSTNSDQAGVLGGAHQALAALRGCRSPVPGSWPRVSRRNGDKPLAEIGQANFNT